MATSMCDPPGEKLYEKSVLGADIHHDPHGQEVYFEPLCDVAEQQVEDDEEFYGTSVMGSEYQVEDEYDPEMARSMIEEVMEDSRAESAQDITFLPPTHQATPSPDPDSTLEEKHEDRVPEAYNELQPIAHEVREESGSSGRTESTQQRGIDRPHPTVHPSNESLNQKGHDFNQPLARVKRRSVVAKNPAIDPNETMTSNSSGTDNGDGHVAGSSLDFLSDTKRSSLLNLPLVKGDHASSDTEVESMEYDRRKMFKNIKACRDPDLELVNEAQECSLLKLPIVRAVFASNSCLTLTTSTTTMKAGPVDADPTHDGPTVRTSSGTLGKMTGEINPQFIRVVLERLRRDEGFPFGLGLDFIKSTKSIFPLRLWLVDNNHISTKEMELRKALETQVQLARLFEVSSIICMVNGVVYDDPTDYSYAIMAPPESKVANESGAQPQRISKDAQATVKKLLKKSQKVPPKNLDWNSIMEDVKRRIQAIEAELLWNKQRVLLVIATDHLPVTDDSFCHAVASVQRLPVDLVARVVGTSNSENALNHYRGVVEERNLPLHVLGDFDDHERRVFRFNSWLNYARPLHVSRETGYEPRIFGILEEKTLNRDELREFLVRLFGRLAMVTAPDIYSQWSAFFPFLVKLNNSNGRHRRKLTGKLEPWIDMEKLNEFYFSPDSANPLDPTTLEAGIRLEI